MQLAHITGKELEVFTISWYSHIMDYDSHIPRIAICLVGNGLEPLMTTDAPPPGAIAAGIN